MKWWWQLRKSEADLERELRSDLELEEEEQRESGLPPEEASHAARRAFGNEVLIKEQIRDGWCWVPFERLWQDLLCALRQLRRTPRVAAPALLVLGLGIRVSVQIFEL